MNALSLLENKKVLVTGGAGFVGSHLCEELVNLGSNVISADNYSAGKKENIKFLQKYDNFQAVNMDVTQKDGWDDIFTDLDIIFHNAASKKNICLMNPQRDLEVNAGGTLNLLLLASKFRIDKFVHASTGSVYGEPEIFPSDEAHPLNPVSYYGVSKLAGERYVAAFNRLYGMNTTILRYFHVYGTRQESNEFGGVVSIFLRKILENKSIEIFGDGQQVRSFTYVKDLVKANLLAAVTPEASGEVFNAASGISISINELATGLKKLTKSDVSIIYGKPLVGDITNFDISNEKIKDILNIKFDQDFWGRMNEILEDFNIYLKSSIRVGES